MTFGLTTTGFKRKMFEDLTKDIVNDLIETYGPVNTAKEDALMQLIAILTKQSNSIWEMAEYVNNSMYPDTAFGISLDYICSYIGIKRIQATKTTTLAKLTGKNQIEIPINSKVTAINVNTVFNLEKSIILSNENCFDITLIIADIIQNNFTFYLYINDEYFSYQKQSGDTITIIINHLVTSINNSNQMIEAENIENKLFIKTTNNDNLMEVFLSQYISIDTVSNLGTFIAENAGYITLAINGLTNIQTPVAGWISVINEFTPVIGRDLETDEELRIRRQLSINLIGAGTLEAIRAKLLNLPGVIAVLVTENATNQVVDSLPPHSFECLVMGGDDYEIASMIWNVKGAGIETFGNLTIQVKDSTGQYQEIKFSRPIPIYIYVDVELTIDDTIFPINGNDLIKDNIIKKITQFGVGDDILYQSLFGAIYNVPGVTLATVSIGGNNVESKPTLYEQNILIQKNQIQKIDLSKITITSLL